MTPVGKIDYTDGARAPAAVPASAAPTAVAARWYSGNRIGGLSRFAVAISLLNLAGHLFLGFEQSWITPLISLTAAYATEIVGETAEAWAQARRPRYVGPPGETVKFLLSAHITGLAVAMLLYACEQVMAVAFAASVAIASKYLARTAVDSGQNGAVVRRHFLNPSNFGITITLLLFPTVGIAPPYQFTENTSGMVDWLLPLLIICTGSYLNTRATGRIPLILSWVVAFAAQALIRSALHGTPWQAGLLPMTGFAFILFTFYMITDPATSPVKTSNQIAFGCAVTFFYAVLMELHVVFGLFYALTIVTALRGLALALQAARPTAPFASREPQSAGRLSTSWLPWRAGTATYVVRSVRSGVSPATPGPKL